MADYTDLTSVKAHLTDSGVDSDYDTILNALISRASRAVDLFAKVPPNYFKVESSSTRYFDGSGELEQRVDPFIELTSVAVAESGDIDDSSGSGGDYTPWSASDYLFIPYNALTMSEPYRALLIDTLNGEKSTWYAYPKSVKISAKWGWSATPPEDIEEATIIQTCRWFKRGQQGFMGSSSLTELGILTLKKLDVDVQSLLDHRTRITI